ncbi:MAG: YncE family protein [Spirochaetota bacterium]
MTWRVSLLLAAAALLASCASVAGPPADAPSDEAHTPTDAPSSDSPLPDAPAPSEEPPARALVPTGATPVRISVGHQPKQVSFTSDGSVLVVPLLADDGIDMISLVDGSVTRVRPQSGGPRAGFTEVVIDPQGNKFYVSQMTAGLIHSFTQAGTYLESFATHGEWSKYMQLAPDRSLLAVSNWLSDTVSLLSPRGELLRTIRAAGAVTPRGVAFEPDGKHLIVSWFGSGELTRHRVSDGALLARYTPGGAMRHVVIDSAGSTAYASNMARREVVALALPDLRVPARSRVGSNPNTIVISADGALLYVSCRGPNNPAGYTHRSPEPGAIHVIATATMETLQIIPAGTQPTGLALSPDGKLLSSTSFQDDEVLLWALIDGLVEGLAEPPPRP